MLSLELQNSQSPNDLPAKSVTELETIELEDKIRPEVKSMPILYQAPKRDHFIFLFQADKSSVGSFINSLSHGRPAKVQITRM